MGSLRGWGQQLAGTPRYSCTTGSYLSPYYSAEQTLFLFSIIASCLLFLSADSVDGTFVFGL